MKTLFLSFFIVSLLLLNICCNTRQREINKLQKYSYLLIGVTGINTTINTTTGYPLGTCFFIRNKGTLYLVTAKHCVDGYNTFNLKSTGANFDTIGLRYYIPKKKKYIISNLIITPFKKYLRNDYFFNSPDLVVFSFRDSTVEPFINSIESNFIDDEKEHQIIDRSIVFGYGIKDISKFTITTKPVLYEGYFPEKTVLDPYYPINDNIYYTMQPKSIPGVSGSPVFIEYHTLHNKKKRIDFGGLVFGTDTIYNLAYVVHSYVVKDMVNSFGK